MGAMTQCVYSKFGKTTNYEGIILRATDSTVHIPSVGHVTVSPTYFFLTEVCSITFQEVGKAHGINSPDWPGCNGSLGCSCPGSRPVEGESITVSHPCKSHQADTRHCVELSLHRLHRRPS